MDETTRMQSSDSIAKFAEAFAAAQGEMKNPTKDNTADAGKYKYSYADLAAVYDACKGPLTKNGISILQSPSTNQAGVSVTTMLIHSSGEWVSSTLTIGCNKNDAQGIGSAISYARRYSLSAMVGLAPEDDDDANAAVGKPAAIENRRKPPQETPKTPPKQSAGSGVGKLKADMQKAGCKTIPDGELLVRWLSNFAQGEEPKFAAIDDYKGKEPESMQLLVYIQRATEAGNTLETMLSSAKEWDLNDQAVEAFSRESP